MKLTTASRPNDNMVIENGSPGNTFMFVSFVPKVNMTCNVSYWWIDIGANIYARVNHSVFLSFQDPGGRNVVMGNDALACVLGIGRIKLKLT